MSRLMNQEEIDRLAGLLVAAFKQADLWLLQHDLDDSGVRYDAVQAAVDASGVFEDDEIDDDPYGIIYGTSERAFNLRIKAAVRVEMKGHEPFYVTYGEDTNG
jgi:hypothetical protein